MEVVGQKDSIFFFRELLTSDECSELINLFEKSENKQQGQMLTDEGLKVEDPNKVSIELEMPTAGDWAQLFEKLHQNVSDAILKIIEKTPALQVHPLVWSQYKIKKYETNEGHFNWHFDALGPAAWQRQLAIIIYLNDVTEGGQTQFFHQELEVSPESGLGIIFPPFWTHMHQGVLATSGPKYILTSFAQFQGL